MQTPQRAISKKGPENDHSTACNKPEDSEQRVYNKPPLIGINDEILFRHGKFLLFTIALHSSYSFSHFMRLAKNFLNLIYFNTLNSINQNHNLSPKHTIL